MSLQKTNKTNKKKNQNKNNSQVKKDQTAKENKYQQHHVQNSQPSKKEITKNAAPSIQVREVNTDKGKYSRRKIESNWGKDDIPDDIYDEVEKSSHGATNILELFRKPISTGDHFQFKSEKNWKCESNLNDNHLFTIDFTKVNEHISCIPFYEIAKIDKSLFSNYQIEIMNENAKRNMNLYENNSKSDNLKNLQNPNSSVLENSNFYSNQNDTEIYNPFKKLIENTLIRNPNNRNELNNSDSSDSDELSELLQMSKISSNKMADFPTSNNNIDSKTEKSNDEEDLEEWINEYLKN